MLKMPPPEVYEQELVYMPYKESLRCVLQTICSRTPQNASLVDLMCGPGYLLGKIAERRKDLSLLGIDLDQGYIDHSRARYPGIGFEQGDILEWTPSQKFDAVICTGALHHIPYERQAEAVKRMASMMKPDGFCLISDAYIDDYSNEKERKIAAATLGHEYLKETIKNGAPAEVIAAAIDILRNDVMMEEYKTSLTKRLAVFWRIFSKVELFKTWPDETRYGDYFAVCKNVRI